MDKTSENLTQVNQKAVEAALQFAHASLENAERVMHMQIEAARKLVAQQSESIRMLTGVKNPQELAAAHTRVVEKSVESVLGYSRDISNVAVETQRNLAKVAEQCFAAYQKEMSAAVEQMVPSGAAGTGADPAAAMKSTMAAATAAIDNMTKAAKQAAEFAETNVKAMTEAATNAFKSGVRKDS